jgi:hypothetical protein
LQTFPLGLIAIFPFVLKTTTVHIMSFTFPRPGRCKFCREHFPIGRVISQVSRLIEDEVHFHCPICKTKMFVDSQQFKGGLEEDRNDVEEQAAAAATSSLIPKDKTSADYRLRQALNKSRQTRQVLEEAYGTSAGARTRLKQAPLVVVKKKTTTRKAKHEM